MRKIAILFIMLVIMSCRKSNGRNGTNAGSPEGTDTNEGCSCDDLSTGITVNFGDPNNPDSSQEYNSNPFFTAGNTGFQVNANGASIGSAYRLSDIIQTGYGGPWPIKNAMFGNIIYSGGAITIYSYDGFTITGIFQTNYTDWLGKVHQVNGYFINIPSSH